ncbi:hypothetical protein T01_9808 [Trichinella spiralis]|uniref:Uncharacterized protein n=1 Tax=Trichinella spiralis TaxID=6334 RepID=A0A0V0YWZ7_TRISP|nr:hypothetical protein T01_9808 [Trichinella spiralis]
MFPCYWIHLHVLQSSSIFELRVCRSSKKSSIFSIASLIDRQWLMSANAIEE